MTTYDVALDAVAAIDATEVAATIAYADNDLDALANMLAHVGTTITVLRNIEAMIEAATMAAMDRTGTTEAITSAGTLIKTSGREKKRYDHARIVSTLAARMADELTDRETGERAPLAVVCETVAREMANATGATAPSFTGWRAGVLKSHGMNVHSYCDHEDGTPKLLFTPR